MRERASPILFLVLVDALRWDKVGPGTTPFLDRVAHRGVRARVAEPLGFETGPAFAAGLWPEESGIAYEFVYNPESAPFRFARRIPRWFLRPGRGRGRIRRWALDRAEKAAIRAGLEGARDHLYTLSMGAPPEAWPWFGLALDRPIVEPRAFGGHPTLFDLLRESDRPFLHLARPDSPLDTESNVRIFEERFTGREDLVYVHFGEPDWVMHREGPESEAYHAALGRADRAFQTFHEKASASGRRVATVAFGDHGALEVVRRVDVAAALQRLDLVPWRDYAYFLDSTAARFWFHGDRANRLVTDALADLEAGAWLTSEDRERYRVRFRDSRQWEKIFLLEAGAVIEPCFYQGEKPVRGMHGYRPEVEPNLAALVVEDPTGDAGLDIMPSDTRPMVEIFPIARRLLGL